jgi:hypothetical protein
MSSPLLPYVNALLLVQSTGEVTVVNGRVVSEAGPRYVLQAYMVRQDSTGVTTGAEYAPTRQSPGDVLPGASGEVYLYRGYGLRWSVAPQGYELGGVLGAGQVWVELNAATLPEWLSAGTRALHLHGTSESPKECRIERVTGKYGGSGIDQVISNEIKGVPMVLRSGDVID